MVDVYNFVDPIQYIKARVDSEKSSWGLWSKLAVAAGCQPTYLSRAIQGKVLLTPEHLIGISKFWNLSESETDYFHLILEYSRAGTPALRQFLKTKIEKIKRERENISKRLNKPRLEVSNTETLYYSAWFWSALHIIVSIPQFQTVDAISKRLLLPPEQVKLALDQLKTLGVVDFSNGKWKLGTGDLHIPVDSPLVGVHHGNWRQRAVTDASMRNPDSLHYTGVYSISKKDFIHLKEKMLDLVEYSRKVIGPSKEEEIICFACDLFVV